MRRRGPDRVMMWRLGISTGACTELGILDALGPIAASGVTAVEISTPPRHFDPLRPDAVDALARGLTRHGLEAISIHAPFGGLLDLADPNDHHRVAAINGILTAAAAIKTLGGRIIVVHPSDLERARHDAGSRLADSARSLTILADHCHLEGLTLAVETPLPHLVGGQPDEFAWLLAQVDGRTRVCLDTGHTTLGGHWRDFVRIAGRRTIHVHAHDNNGRRDDHLPPGDGRIDWAEIVSTLAEAGFDGTFVLELACPPGELGPYLKRAVDHVRTLA